ncbi:MAG: RNA polymerase sigma-70 factor [Bacteroidetes bacterium]|nr:RNA polymerase sigma-70 factor [Bacteroidota bacterium]
MALFQNAYVPGSAASGTEQDLVERVRAGDQSAIEELFCAYYSGLCRFTLGMTHSRDDVEDLVQDIFVKIWTNREVWSPKGSIKAYLFKAARNQALNFIKNRNSHQASACEGQGEIPSPQDTDPSVNLDHKDVRAAISTAISKLPQKCRIVFVLNRQEGLAYSEIADVLGISEKTVENQMSRALRILRTSLRPLTR